MFFAAARVGAHCDAAALVFWAHIIVVPISLAAALIAGPSLLPADTALWWPVMVVAISYVGAYSLQILALRVTSAVHAGLFFNLEPIMTGIVAAIFVGERLLPLQYAGAVLVIVALLSAGPGAWGSARRIMARS
jgi:drug/metabolite transporter (DMT)-like permease